MNDKGVIPIFGLAFILAGLIIIGIAIAIMFFFKWLIPLALGIFVLGVFWVILNKPELLPKEIRTPFLAGSAIAGFALIFIAMFGQGILFSVAQTAPVGATVYCEPSVADISPQDREQLGIVYTSSEPDCVCYNRQTPKYSEWINVGCVNKDGGLMLQERSSFTFVSPACTQETESKEYQEVSNDICLHCPDMKVFSDWSLVACNGNNQIDQRKIGVYQGTWIGGEWECEPKEYAQYRYSESSGCGTMQWAIIFGLIIAGFIAIALGLRRKK